MEIQWVIGSAAMWNGRKTWEFFEEYSARRRPVFLTDTFTDCREIDLVPDRHNGQDSTEGDLRPASGSSEMPYLAALE
jgi:hypothetical protein